MSTIILLVVIIVLCTLCFAAGRVYELRNRMDHWHDGFEEAKRIYAAGNMPSEEAK